MCFYFYGNNKNTVTNKDGNNKNTLTNKEGFVIEFNNYKTWIFTPVLVVTFLFTVNSFAVTTTEMKKDTTTEITITFTQDEYDLFSLDKDDPKEWIRNAIAVNLADHTQRIKADLTKDIVPSEADFKAKVQALQAEKLANEEKLKVK